MTARSEPVVYLDCSEPSFHQKRWYEALHFVVENLVNALEIPKKAHLHLAPPDSYDEKEASASFESDLQKISIYCEKQRVLIIFDEIENLTFDISPSDHWASDKDFLYFWQTIRSIYQKNATLFSVIIAGVNPTIVETPSVQGYDNPIYRLMTPRYLGFFDVQEVGEMISFIGRYMGLSFEDEISTYLVDEYGGHPFLIRQVCSFMHRNTQGERPTTVTKFRYQSLKPEMDRGVRDYIGAIVNILKKKYKIEYELLEYLAQGDQETFQEFARMSDTLINHLSGYGLIQEESGAYHFRIRAVADYIDDNVRVKHAISKNDKWSAITQQRNNLEESLRKVVKMALKFQYGSVEGRERFLEVISPRRRKQILSAMNFDEIFDGEIYFMDYEKVILKNWSVLGKVFGNDREHFKTYMEFVNKHRVDAHAKEIDHDTFAILTIAIKWLQQHTDKFLS